VFTAVYRSLLPLLSLTAATTVTHCCCHYYHSLLPLLSLTAATTVTHCCCHYYHSLLPLLSLTAATTVTHCCCHSWQASHGSLCGEGTAWPDRVCSVGHIVKLLQIYLLYHQIFNTLESVQASEAAVDALQCYCWDY
jgi:hypothetical protein